MRPFNKILIFISLLSLTSCQNNEKYEELQTENSNLKNEISEIKIKLNDLESRISSNSEFENEMKCQEMLDRLKNRWNNVIGIYYSKEYNTCMVKYVMNGQVKESKIENMKDSDY